MNDNNTHEGPSNRVPPLATGSAGRDWPEDFDHENGNYRCHCLICGEYFTGHKRRIRCKLCEKQAQARWESLTPEQQQEHTQRTAEGNRGDDANCKENSDTMTPIEIFERLPNAVHLARYPQFWPEKYYVANDDMDLSKGFREFSAGGHFVGEYGYPIYRKVSAEALKPLLDRVAELETLASDYLDTIVAMLKAAGLPMDKIDEAERLAYASGTKKPSEFIAKIVEERDQLKKRVENLMGPIRRVLSLRGELDSVRALVVDLAKKWPGHEGVNWETTTTESLVKLIADAVEGDQERADAAEAGVKQYYDNWQAELAGNKVRIEQRDAAIAEADRLRKAGRDQWVELRAHIYTLEAERDALAAQVTRLQGRLDNALAAVAAEKKLREMAAAQVADLKGLLADACASLRFLREAENEDAARAGRNLPWPPEFPPIPKRFTDALASP